MNGLCNVTVGRLGRALGEVAWSLVILEQIEPFGKPVESVQKLDTCPRRNEGERRAKWTADWWR